MATSGTLYQFYNLNRNGRNSSIVKTNDQNNSKFYTTFKWSIASQSIINNTSTISWSYTLHANNIQNIVGPMYAGSWAADDEALCMSVKGFSVSINNSVVKSNTSYSAYVDAGGSLTIASGTLTLNNNDDGTLSPAISCTTNVYNFYNVYSSNSQITMYTNRLFADSWDLLLPASMTGTINLDPTARHAIIKSAPNFTDEDNPTITYEIPNDYTGTVEACISFDGSNVDIQYRPISKTDTSYTFPLNDNERATLYSILNKGIDTTTVRFYIKSTDIDGTTHKSYMSKILTVINYTPIMDPVVRDINPTTKAFTNNENVLVRYLSIAEYNINAEGRKGAYIDTTAIKNGDNKSESSTGTFENITNDTFTFTATDNFGRTIKEEMVLGANFIKYIKLTCKSEVTEMTGEGIVNVTLSGKFYNGYFGANGKLNRMRMHYDIAKNNEDWKHVDKGYIYPSVDNEGNYSYTFPIEDLDYLSVYEITVRVSDEVAVQGTETKVVVASTPIFDWGRTDFNFNVDVAMQENLEVEGNLTVNGTLKLGSNNLVYIAQQGTSSNWNYRLWSDGTAECWRTLEVTSAVATSTNASWYSSGELSATNLTYPFTFTARPAVSVQTMPTGSSYCIVFPSNTTGSTTKTGSYQLMSMSSLTSRTHILSYQVRGRWK